MTGEAVILISFFKATTTLFFPKEQNILCKFHFPLFSAKAIKGSSEGLF